jgi:catechol 2,3-dioxygenase-like lactoylglutathione lyase family enzyme
MLHHVSIGVRDVERAARFYDAALGALGYRRTAEYLPYAIAYGTAAPAFWIQLPHDQQASTPGNGTHIGFAAKNKNAVHKFHEAALANGGQDNGPPGPRDMYGPDYYGAFVLDLDGNRLEATLHAEVVTSAKPKAKARKKPSRKAKRKTSKTARKKAPKKKSAKRKVRRR